MQQRNSKHRKVYEMDKKRFIKIGNLSRKDVAKTLEIKSAI